MIGDWGHNAIGHSLGRWLLHSHFATARRHFIALRSVCTRYGTIHDTPISNRVLLILLSVPSTGHSLTAHFHGIVPPVSLAVTVSTRAFCPAITGLIRSFHKSLTLIGSFLHLQSIMCNVDSQGRCAKHDFVQVKRLSRTGEWKSLLEACPLCAMDTPGAKNESSEVAVATPASSNEVKRSFRVSFSQETAGLEVRKDYQFRPSSSSLQCIDSSDRSIVSVGSIQSVTRSALKSPKYKVCPKKMNEQRNLEVTTMSMDLDIEESDDEDEVPRQQSPLPPEQPKRPPPPPPRRESRHKEQKSKVNPRMIGKSPVRSSMRRSTTSSSGNSNDNASLQQQQVRPNPAESIQELVCTEIQEPHENQFTCRQVPFIMTRDVSDDVSAISFMGSVYSNQQPNNFNALVPFQEEEEETEDNDFDFDNDEETICTSTNNYDSKGRCVRHPHVRLRKKKFLGRGWKVLMSACPDCCVDELRRLHAKKRSMDIQKPTKKVIPRHTIKGKESDDTASLSSSSQGSSNGNQKSVVKKQDDGIFVKNMAWTDGKGRRGSYTGEVDNQFIPNGKGSMQYEDSNKVKEGEWKDGRKSSSGRSKARSSERSSRSRSVSVRPGARSRSTSVTPKTRARSSSRARVTPEF